MKEQGSRPRRLNAQRDKLLDAWMDGLIDKTDFQDRPSRLEVETTDAKRLLAAAQISHEGVLAVVDTCVKALQYAGVLFRQMPDDSRQTFNQARYDAIHIDTDDSGTPIVTRTDIVPILAEVESVVRPHVSPVGSQAEEHANRPDEPATTTPPPLADATEHATAPPSRIGVDQNRTPTTSTMTWVPT